MRRAVFFLLLISTTFSIAQQQGIERFTRVIGRLTEAMNNQDYAGILREYDKGMSVAFPLFKTTYFFKNNFDSFGKILKVDPPQLKAPDQAICVLTFERGAQDLTLYIDDQNKIKGFLFTTHVVPEPPPTPEIKPEPKPAPTTPPPVIAETKAAPVQTPPPAVTAEPKPAPQKSIPPPETAATPVQPVAPVVPDKQQTELYPPFKGSWTVIAGGEFQEGAAQRNLLQQQYAYEFSGMDANGNRYKNNGKALDDYAGYGKEVLAPANGTVVEAIDGIRENSPGMRNPYVQIGNAIIIQHSNREYSVLAYLKQGSVRVKAGDKVTRGQVIAQCGGSGSATEPVIHYHLQDTPYLQSARGLKFYFDRAFITKDGKKELQLIHLPEAGEVISSE
jgi:murein DD-endopeptidase MepM/ murein hydrolase activator NlpD